MARSRRPLGAMVLLVVGCTDVPYQQVAVDMTPVPARTVPAASPLGPVMRFSVAAMQSPADTFSDYSRFLGRLAARLGGEARFVQRRTYREVNELLLAGQLDAALLCTGGFLHLRAEHPGAVEVLAVPVIDGKTSYHSLVVVPASSAAGSLDELQGQRFAYTDELSLSGYLYVVSLLSETGGRPDRYFSSTQFTQSHDRSIDAVARGLVDGAAVDSLVFETLSKRDPLLKDKVKVIHRSPAFGVMPFVASLAVPVETRAKLRAALLTLHEDPEAAAALRAVHIERFVPPPPGIYDGAALVARRRR